MLFILGCAIIAVMRFAPETMTARALTRLLVEMPLRAVRRLGRTNLILMLLLAAAAIALIAWAKTEGLYLTAQMVPEGIAWVAAFDIGTWVDLMVMGWILGATVRLKALRQGADLLLQRFRRTPTRVPRGVRPRAPQGLPRLPERGAANDDEPEPPKDLRRPLATSRTGIMPGLISRAAVGC